MLIKILGAEALKTDQSITGTLVERTMRPNTLITDFDNTLYDWFHMWFQSFNAMLTEVARISGLDEETLIPQIRKVHQKYGTSEYSFLLEELPCLKAMYPEQDIAKVFDEAIHAYRSARKSSLRLYGGVLETLTDLRSKGVLIVIYTESLGYYTNFRIQRLGLGGLVDFVYSPPDHDLPSSHTQSAGALLQAERGNSLDGRHHYLPEGVVKPNPEVLLDIVSDIKRHPTECIYVGDSLMKDVAMAQDAGITDVLAAYGAVQHKEEYDLLRKVSHWPDSAVTDEKHGQKRIPSHSISKFAEIANFFRE